MNLVIPSYNRAENISTPFLNVFGAYDKTILLHDKEQVKEYKKYNEYNKIKLLDTGVKTQKDGTGLPMQRKHYIDNYMEDGEWVLFADDNISFVEGVLPHKVWKNKTIEETDKDYFGKYSSRLFYERIEEIKDYADSIGAYHIGFQTSKNYFYAHKKYRTRGYVIGKMTLWKKDKNFNFELPFCHMEDFHFSLMHLSQYGKVLICDYLWANATHYQQGGLGVSAHRRSARVDSVAYLVSKYPQIVKVKKRKDNYPDLRITNMSDFNFKMWHKQYNAFKKEYVFNNDSNVWVKSD
jgi:hypothetical protein